MARPSLFTATDLAQLLQRPVPADAAEIAERVAAGWLSGAGVDITVDPVPDKVFAAAVELGAIAHENPTGLESQTVDGQIDEYGRRRETILATASASSGYDSQPLGSFPPPPLTWPAW